MTCIAPASFTYCGQAAGKYLKKGVPRLEMRWLPIASTQQREHPCTLFYSASLVLSWAC
jgi:hypothetical protein